MIRSYLEVLKQPILTPEPRFLLEKRGVDVLKYSIILCINK